jgi:hypothetical protein
MVFAGVSTYFEAVNLARQHKALVEHSKERGTGEFWRIEFQVKGMSRGVEVSFKKMLPIKLVPELPAASKVKHFMCWAHDKVDPNNYSGRVMKALAGPLTAIALKSAVGAAAPPTVALFM